MLLGPDRMFCRLDIGSIELFRNDESVGALGSGGVGAVTPMGFDTGVIGPVAALSGTGPVALNDGPMLPSASEFDPGPPVIQPLPASSGLLPKPNAPPILLGKEPSVDSADEPAPSRPLNES